MRGFGFVRRGVIGRAHERPGFHVFEAHGFTQYFELGKFVGMYVPNDGKMLARRFAGIGQE